MNLCPRCNRPTHKLTEHRSEVDDSIYCPDCCPGGCDSPDDHDWPRSIGLPLPCAVDPI